MAYRLFDFSSDVGVEADAPTPEATLVELCRGVAQVLTDGSTIRPTVERTIDFEAGPDWPAIAVATVNEAVYLFDTEQFLVAAGDLRGDAQPGGLRRIHGVFRGEILDPKRHRAGRGVKAATYHDATHRVANGTHTMRLVLDL